MSEIPDGAGDQDLDARHQAGAGAPGPAEPGVAAGAGGADAVNTEGDGVDAGGVAETGQAKAGAAAEAGGPEAGDVDAGDVDAELEPAEDEERGPAGAGDATREPGEEKKKDKSGKGKKGKGGGAKKKALAAEAAGAALPEAAQPFPPPPPPPPPPPLPEPVEPEPVGAGQPGSWLAANAFLLVMTVIAVVAVVGLVLSRVQLGDRDSVAGAQTSALSAAKTYAVDIASYDYRHLDQDFGAVLAHSTPAFRQSFGKSSNELRSTLVKFKATAKASVVAAGVVSATSTQAVVLVFLEQTVTNAAQKAPTTDRTQVEITLDHSGGSWLINQVTLL